MLEQVPHEHVSRVEIERDAMENWACSVVSAYGYLKELLSDVLQASSMVDVVKPISRG